MTWIDIIILVIVIPAALSGFRKGLLRMAGALAGLILGILLCGPLSPIFEPLVGKIISGSAGVVHFVAKGVVVLLFYIAGSVAGRFLKAGAKMLSLSLIDKVLGAVASVAEVLFVTSLFIAMVESIRLPQIPLGSGEQEQTQQTCPINSAKSKSLFYKYVRAFYPAVVGSLKERPSQGTEV